MWASQKQCKSINMLQMANSLEYWPTANHITHRIIANLKARHHFPNYIISKVHIGFLIGLSWVVKTKHETISKMKLMYPPFSYNTYHFLKSRCLATKIYHQASACACAYRDVCFKFKISKQALSLTGPEIQVKIITFTRARQKLVQKRTEEGIKLLSYDRLSFLSINEINYI